MKKVYVISSNTLCGNSLLTEIVTVLTDKKEAETVCKEHNKTWRELIPPTAYKLDKTNAFDTAEEFKEFVMKQEELKVEREKKYRNRPDVGYGPCVTACETLSINTEGADKA